MSHEDVFIVGAARTPIGKYGGSFKGVHAAELGGEQRAPPSPTPRPVLLSHRRSP